MIFIVVNGYPRSGKDTVIDLAGKYYITKKVSTIDDIRKAAMIMGWNGEKDIASRKMLSDLKDFSTAHFDGPFKRITRMVKEFDGDFFFTMSREGHEIERFRSWSEQNGIPFKYILVERGNERIKYGNHADDDVLAGAIPDITIYNNDGLLDLQMKVRHIMDEILYESDTNREKDAPLHLHHG